MLKTMYENPFKTVIFGLVAGSVVEGVVRAARGNGYVVVSGNKSKNKSKRNSKGKSNSRKKR